jgi:hypothetical protein
MYAVCYRFRVIIDCVCVYEYINILIRPCIVRIHQGARMRMTSDTDEGGGGDVPRLWKLRTTRFRDVVRFIPVFNTKSVLMVPVLCRCSKACCCERWRWRRGRRSGGAGSTRGSSTATTGGTDLHVTCTKFSTAAPASAVDTIRTMHRWARIVHSTCMYTRR